jgi:alanine-alpha-ketoisovalerate/valine-pyruvate aminotransferase
MGGEKAPERVLIVFYQEMPDELQKDIRSKFSDAEVTIHKSEGGVPVPPGMSR